MLLCGSRAASLRAHEVTVFPLTHMTSPSAPSTGLSTATSLHSRPLLSHCPKHIPSHAPAQSCRPNHLVQLARDGGFKLFFSGRNSVLNAK